MTWHMNNGRSAGREGGQMLPKPYYQEQGITIYHGDCAEILPHLEPVCLLLTDPPYGIGRSGGNKSTCGAGFYMYNARKKYPDAWDGIRQEESLVLALGVARLSIVWGGNYYTDVLSQSAKWLVWDKCNTMPTFSDAELAWTNLQGVSVKMLKWSGNGLMAAEKNRVHPTQKPIALMHWCIDQAPEDVATILDPFMGSGTTLVAARNKGRKCIGIEREEKYCAAAVERLRQQTLFAC